MEILNEIWKMLVDLASKSNSPNSKCSIYVGHEEWVRIMNCVSSSVCHMEQTIFGHRFYQVNELNHLQVFELEK